MLVLSRRPGERICIGGAIELEAVAIRGKQVKLGIRCPREVRILCAELADSPIIKAGAPVEKLSELLARRKQRKDFARNERQCAFRHAAANEEG